jgi:hypothetical protein
MARFPDVKRDLTPKYNKAFARFEEQIPLLRGWVRMGMIEPQNALLTGLVVALGLGVLALEVPRRLRRRRERPRGVGRRPRRAA